MGTLNGRAPRDSYKELLKTRSEVMDSTLQQLTTGDDVAAPIKISSTTIEMGGVSFATNAAAPRNVLALGSDPKIATWKSQSAGSGEDVVIEIENLAGQPYDFAVCIPGKPLTYETMYRVIIERAFKLESANGYASTSASSMPVIFTVYKNDVSIGTVTFPVGKKAAVSTVPETTFQVGDKLRVQSSSAVNATLQSPSLFFKAELI